MDKEKTGIFVHELRKEKQMTQKEMADKLGITDKAVSKWERGLSYPDISMLEPIAKLLDVSVMELLQGQRIENETVISVEKAQEVIDQSLIISDSEIHRKHVRSKTAILICSMLLMFMISLLLNVYNLMHRQSMMQNFPQTNLPAYDITRDEDGNWVFSHPYSALSQMQKDSDEALSSKWSYVLKIMENTYKTEVPE